MIDREQPLFTALADDLASTDMNQMQMIISLYLLNLLVYVKEKQERQKFHQNAPVSRWQRSPAQIYRR